ncbi:MAG: permease prefix domain 1-containing protein [Bacillota bacterium]|nr:permease prefix domain 1-containing protein [Bacillota bacterium]
MDTINTYLDNIFATLPKTEAVLRARTELQASMEEKYQALKAEGKSENEAVGSVISEFGNIDELITELGIGTGSATEEESLPLLDRDGVAAFLSANAQAARLIGLGVLCCILGAALMILTNLLGADGFLGSSLSGGAIGALALLPLFLLVAVGVGLFIYSGVRMEKFTWLEQGFVLQTGLKTELEKQQEQFLPSFTVAIIIGVGLCILSPAALFAATLFPQFDPQYGLIVLLAMIAVAVFIFIRFGKIKDGYARLLQQGEYTRPSKKAGKSGKADKITGAVASAVFPLAALAYLLMGFLGGLWHPGWLIFPITGILFGIFSSIVEAIVGK